VNDGQGVRRGLIEARVAAVAVIGLGIVSLVGASQVRPPAGYAAVSASVMPAVVGVGLVAFGILLLVRATVRPDLDHAARVAAEAAATHWPTTLLAVGALVAYALLLAPLGYVLATSLFLPAQARILGSRSPLRDLIIGVALGVVVFVIFTQFLGVRLPAGLLEPVLP
jgi:putative tricarboxylic transport membrane protein